MSKETQLLDAASDGNLAAVVVLLGEGVPVDAKDEFNSTALNRACSNGHAEVVALLIERGADINNNGGADMTPLMNAATAGHVAIARMLMEKGAIITMSLLRAMDMKVGILYENEENGMVQPGVAKAWHAFLDELVARFRKQNPE